MQDLDLIVSELAAERNQFGSASSNTNDDTTDVQPEPSATNEPFDSADTGLALAADKIRSGRN